MISSYKIHHFINFLTLLLITSFYLLENILFGKFIIIGISFLIFVLDSFESKKITFKISSWHIWYILFTIFILSSSLWALNSENSIDIFIRFIIVFISLFPVFNYYKKGDNTLDLLDIIKWSGYIMVLANFFIYGLDKIINSIIYGIRLDNSLMNVNSIAIPAVFSILIDLYEIINKKRIVLSNIIILVALVMILATQSRKAIFALFFGIILILFFSIKSKNKIKILIKSFCLIFLVTFSFLLILQLPVFSGIKQRLLSLFNGFFGDGSLDDGSVNMRQRLIEVGFYYFKQRPLFGYGIGNAHILANFELSFDAYLHNNFIELLVNGGLVGFILYYSAFLYLFSLIFKNRKINKKLSNISLILIIIILILDYGQVSYTARDIQFDIMFFFLIVNYLKKGVNVHENINRC